MNRAMSSSRKVSVSFDWLPIDSDHVADAPPAVTQALDDEAVRRLHQQDVLHGALVEERSDGAEDLLEVLARTAFVDPHAVRSSWVRIQWSGPATHDLVRGAR